MFYLAGFRSVVTLFLLMLFGLSFAHADSLRMSAKTLEKNLNQSDLVIIDSRSAAHYQQGHLPGAIHFPELLTYHDKSTNGRIVQPAQLQALLRERGMDTDQTVVVYDNGEISLASRVFWTLEVYGFDKVKVLNQGYKGWLNEEFSISFDVPKRSVSDYVPVINHQRLATKLTTQIASKNPNQMIIDARNVEAYTGLESSAKRFGHIPKAINIPASHNLSSHNQLNTLQPISKLEALYSQIPKNQKVVLYCAIGRVSATNYLALRELGYNVANYDASWKEWGNDFNLPIEK